jgi:hypothetical protein
MVAVVGLLMAPAAAGAPARMASPHVRPTLQSTISTGQAISPDVAQQPADGAAADARNQLRVELALLARQHAEQVLAAQQQAAAAAAQQAAQQAQDSRVVGGDNPADATSVATSDWACIRSTESGGNYTDVSGAYGVLVSTWAAYGFSGTPGQASASTQDAFALRLFAANGYKFAGTWNNPCTMGGSLR